MALYMHVGREGLLALHLYPPPVCVCVMNKYITHNFSYFVIQLSNISNMLSSVLHVKMTTCTLFFFFLPKVQ